LHEQDARRLRKEDSIQERGVKRTAPQRLQGEDGTDEDCGKTAALNSRREVNSTTSREREGCMNRAAKREVAGRDGNTKRQEVVIIKYYH
jgi:hypothetical protein